MVILLFEWEKASGFQLLVCSKFWDCVIVCLEISHFIMFYILNKTKAYILCNLNEFSYRWVDFRKSNPLISTHLKLKMCVWQPDEPQRPAHFTIFPFKLLLTSCQITPNSYKYTTFKISLSLKSLYCSFLIFSSHVYKYKWGVYNSILTCT
jgi:hypothetical protein